MPLLGQSQKEKIIEDARKRKEGAFFKSQAVYTFDRFSTDLEEAFQTLYDYEEPVSEAEKIRLLREKINTDNASFNASVMALLMRPDINTFAGATAEVNVLVNKFFPPIKPKGRYGIALVDVAKYVTSSSNGRQFHNGVDITEFTRFYPQGEWEKLSSELQAAIREAKAEQDAAEEGINESEEGGGKGKRKAQNELNDKEVKKMKEQISALIKKVSDLEEKSKEHHQAEERTDVESKSSGSEATGPKAFAKGARQ